MTGEKLFADGTPAPQDEPFGGRARIESWKREAEGATKWRPMRSVLTAETDEEVQSLIEAAVEKSRQEMQQQLDAKVEELTRSAAAIENARAQALRETESDLVDLALHIAREVIGISIEEQREFTAKMAEHALGLLRESDRVTLRVASEHADALRVHLAENDHGHVELIEDPSMTDAGVVAECELGRVDATLTRRLSEAAEALEKTRPA
ncbi:MAG: FliH/SctL family protein [Myxococcota bacterium]